MGPPWTSAFRPAAGAPPQRERQQKLPGPQRPFLPPTEEALTARAPALLRPRESDTRDPLDADVDDYDGWRSAVLNGSNDREATFTSAGR
jgi:hypothetical protein